MRRAHAAAGQNGSQRRASDAASDGQLAALLTDPVIASWLLRAAVRDLAEAARAGGVRASPKCQLTVQALYDAAHPAPVAVDGHIEDAPEMIDHVRGAVTVARLAEDTGYSPRTLRRWAAAGRLRAVRAGPVWLIDPESLKEGAV